MSENINVTSPESPLNKEFYSVHQKVQQCMLDLEINPERYRMHIAVQNGVPSIQITRQHTPFPIAVLRFDAAKNAWDFTSHPEIFFTPQLAEKINEVVASTHGEKNALTNRQIIVRDKVEGTIAA